MRHQFFEFLGGVGGCVYIPEAQGFARKFRNFPSLIIADSIQMLLIFQSSTNSNRFTAQFESSPDRMQLS